MKGCKNMSSDLQIKINAEISGVKLVEECKLSDNVSNVILEKMREEKLSFQKAVESFFGSVQHNKNGSVMNKKEVNKSKSFKRKRLIPWTQEETELLILNACNGYKECKNILPRRSYRAIVAKGKKLGLSLGVKRNNKEWTEKEIDILIDYSDRLSYKQLGTILGRSEKAISFKLYELRH
jgi:hypothetical protein